MARVSRVARLPAEREELIDRLFHLLNRSRRMEEYWRTRAAKAEGKRRVWTPYAVALAFMLWAMPAMAAGPNVTGSNVILWDAVTQNEDGTAITDLAGYELIICGTSPCLPSTPGAVIYNVGLTSTPAAPTVTIGSLSPAVTKGQRYVVARSYNVDGFRSAGVSNEVPFVYGSNPRAPANVRIQ